MPIPNSSVHLNPTQLHLLKMFSYATDERQLNDLKQALTSYFAANIDKEMDKLWEEGKWNDEKNEEILDENLHANNKKK